MFSRLQSSILVFLSFFSPIASAFEEYEYINFAALADCSSFSRINSDATHVCMTLPEYGSSHPAVSVAIEMSGFSDSELSKVRSAIATFNKNWYSFIKTGQTTSKYGECVVNETMNGTFPPELNFPEFAKTTLAGVAYSMLQIQRMFEVHARDKRPIVIKGGELEGAVGWAYLGHPLEDVYGDINLNKNFLNDEGYTATYFAGTILHEWLHRKGYNHEGDGYGDPYYTSHLVVAAGSCMRRDYYPIGFSLAEMPLAPLEQPKDLSVKE